MIRIKRFHRQNLTHGQFDCHIPEDITIRETSKLLDELKQDLSIVRPIS
jgi:hypothetical protein